MIFAVTREFDLGADSHLGGGLAGDKREVPRLTLEHPEQNHRVIQSFPPGTTGAESLKFRPRG